MHKGTEFIYIGRGVCVTGWQNGGLTSSIYARGHPLLVSHIVYMQE